MENPFRFGSDHTFKILQFTDVHWNDGCKKDRKTAALMRTLLEAENPDLIVLTGDTVFGEQNLSQLETALAPVLESEKPWALVFGNHDAEWGRPKEELCEKAMSLKNCRMQPGDLGVSGVGNYTLSLCDSEGKLCWVFYFLDSGSYNQNPEIGGYDYLHRDQIQWYAETNSRLLTQEGRHSALAFFHIPLPEYADVWDYRPCYGDKKEVICSPRQNSGMFSAMLEAGNMRGVFVGHDHVNDYCGDYQGICLAYGRATGYNTYGRRGFPHGARIIRLDESHPERFSSWLRLDNGQVVEQDRLHRPAKKKEDY